MLFQFCDEIRCENIQCVPNAARGRHVASCHDDGLHFSNCRGQITVERCKFHGLMDDPINLHGTSAPVTEILDPRSLRCRFAHRDSLGLALWARSGERLGILSRAHMDTIGTAIVKHFEVTREDEFLLELEGFHLYNPPTRKYESAELIAALAHRLEETGLRYYKCHCTGEKAYATMWEVLGEKVNYLRAGDRRDAL